MPSFDSAGVKIHFEDCGSGKPVVLVHGFAASARTNWEVPGWYDVLAPTYRVLAVDCRGHGLSDRPHDKDQYGAAMADDVIRLLDHLGIRRALLMGYSMGARISLDVIVRHPERIRAAVLGGMGTGRGGMAEPERREAIVRALLAEKLDAVTNPVARQFRQFAEAGGNDLKALAACMAGGRMTDAGAELASIHVPVMVVIGTNDALVGSADELAAAIPNAQLVKLEGRDHLNAPGDKLYKEAVTRFFAAAPE